MDFSTCNSEETCDPSLNMYMVFVFFPLQFCTNECLPHFPQVFWIDASVDPHRAQVSPLEVSVPRGQPLLSPIWHSDLIPPLLNEPLDHPANLCHQINSRDKEKQGSRFSNRAEQHRWPQWPLYDIMDLSWSRILSYSVSNYFNCT